MSRIASSVSLSLLLASTGLGAPLQDASLTPSNSLGAGLFDIARRGFKASPGLEGDDYVFDASFAVRSALALGIIVY